MRWHFLASAAALLVGCDGSTEGGATDNQTELLFQGRHVQTLAFGAADNSEVVKMLPDGTRAVLVASKARRVTLLGVAATGLTELGSAHLFPDDTTESELTHIDFDASGRFAAVTRTRPVVEGGAVVDCRGSLVFVDVQAGDGFGRVLAEIEVGPMPDAVDISDDGGWAVTADEVDFNDGKCPVQGVTPSISVIEIPDGDPAKAVVRARIRLESEPGENLREPEHVVFAPDGDHVAVTLQDTHEVAFFRRSAVVGAPGELAEHGNAALRIVRLPDRASGAEPWPDGISRFVDAAGIPHFIVAGEFNDTLHVLGLDGEHEAHIELGTADVPGDLPRDEAPARFRPDSVSTFRHGGHVYGAFSLKNAGAVGIWLLDDVTDIRLAQIIKVGRDDQGSADAPSTLGTEGIGASDGGYIVTANEDASSVSLIAPIE